jgi:hypothetical protein
MEKREKRKRIVNMERNRLGAKPILNLARHLKLFTTTPCTPRIDQNGRYCSLMGNSLYTDLIALRVLSS